MTSIMGILNVTPDSFYDGGRYVDRAAAIAQAHQMVQAGATIIDIGGESTRPGALVVPFTQEMDRVLPVVEALAEDFKNYPSLSLSIDTRNPEVMLAAIKAGARFINDINALQIDKTPTANQMVSNLLTEIKQTHTKICLMHMKGNPQNMQLAPHYTNVVLEIKDFLKSRVTFCLEQGLKKDQIIIDPGFGFGKTPDHNKALLQNLNAFSDLGVPILVGLSRKSFIEKWLAESVPLADRLAPSIAAALVAVRNGADIIRTHDVQATVYALKITQLFNN